MSKAEDFVKSHIRNCSNAIQRYDGDCNSCTIYNPWITPDQARKAVEIAREEMIEKAVYHIIFNTRTVHYNDYDAREFNKSSLDDIINDLKQTMKDE